MRKHRKVLKVFFFETRAPKPFTCATQVSSANGAAGSDLFQD